MSLRFQVFRDSFCFYLENLLNLAGFLRSNYKSFIATATLKTFLQKLRENYSKFKKHLELIPTPLNEKMLFYDIFL